MGSSVVQFIKREENVIVGAESVVLKDMLANKKVAGVPTEEK